MTRTQIRLLRLAAGLAAFAGAAVAGFSGLAQNAFTQASNQPQALPPSRIDWAAVSRDYNPNRAAVAMRAPGLRGDQKDVDNTDLPILMPDGSAPGTTTDLTFSSFGDVYDITLNEPVANLGVVLSGTRASVRVAGGTFYPRQPDQIMIGGSPQAVFFLQTEEGWMASFNRYGVDYTVTVGCGDDAQSKPYCADDSYIRKLTASLNNVVLGARAERTFYANGGNGKPTQVPVNPNLLKKLDAAKAKVAKTAAGNYKP